MVVTMTLDEVLGAGAAGKKLPQSLDDKLASESDAIQKQSIDFERASRPFSTITDDLKRKYTVLRPAVPFGKSRGNGNAPSTNHLDTPSTSQNSNDSVDSMDAGDVELSTRLTQPQNDGIPDPKFFIDTKPILNDWPKGWTQTKNAIGAGLSNYGNTCFLNSVIQVLTHTAPLVRFALEQHSTADCRAISQGFCAICSFQAHVDRVFKRNGPYGTANPVVPKWVLSHMRSRIMKSYVSGRQEDAHEFLRFFMEAMEASRLVEYKSQKLDGFTKETNMISRIFGGYTRNTITCHLCSEKSSTYDPFLDLSLDIGTRPMMFSHGAGSSVNSVEEALKQFTKIEELSGSNAYKCLKCKRSVKAFKRMQIHRAPQILTIHLKRFDHTGKIGKYISYKEKLDLTPYMSQETTSERALYQLYGVIVHTGNTTHSGHYFAYIRSMNNQWFIADDSRVQTVGDNQTKSAQAYMLFYQRSSPPKAEVRPHAHIPPLPKNSICSTLVDVHMPPTPPPTPGKVTHSVSPFTSSLSRKSVATADSLKPFVKTNGTLAKTAAAHPPASLVPYDDDDESSPSQSPKFADRSTASSAKSSKASTPTNIFERIKDEASSVTTSSAVLLTDEKRPPIRIKINRKLLNGNRPDAAPVKPVAEFAVGDDDDDEGKRAEEEVAEAKKHKKEKKKKHKKEKKEKKEKEKKEKEKKEKKKKRKRKDSEGEDCSIERKRKGDPRDEDDSEDERKRRRLDSDSDFRADHHAQSSSHRHQSHSADQRLSPCRTETTSVEALQAHGGRGYGGLVQSWSADRLSKIEQPLPVERSRSADTDSYDEEVIEERRLKKLKVDRRRSDATRHSNGKYNGDRRNGNDFQHFYDNRNNPEKQKRWSHNSHNNRSRPQFDDHRHRGQNGHNGYNGHNGHNGYNRGNGGNRHFGGERRHY